MEIKVRSGVAMGEEVTGRGWEELSGLMEHVVLIVVAVTPASTQKFIIKTLTVLVKHSTMWATLDQATSLCSHISHCRLCFSHTIFNWDAIHTP